MPICARLQGTQSYRLSRNLVAYGGFEPPTHALSRHCSTPELIGQNVVVEVGLEPTINTV